MQIKLKKIALLLLLVNLLCIPAELLAQKDYLLDVKVGNEESSLFKYEQKHRDSISARQELKTILNKLYSLGYVETSIAEESFDSLQGSVELSFGKQYEWSDLQIDEADVAILGETSYQNKFFEDEQFSFASIRKVQEEILTYLENNGYPFASTALDAIKIEKGRVSAKLKIDKNKLMFFDSLNLVGDANISHQYIKNYLGIKKGQLYNEALIRKITPRLDQLPFLSSEKPFNIYFIEDKAQVNLFLNDKKASRFDFLIGFLPNSNEEGKLLVTGQADLNLVNTFGRGTNFELTWERLKTSTQNLRTRFKYPYLLSSPLGIDVGLEIYRRDSTFFDLITDVGMQYLFVGGNYVKAFFENKRSSLLTIDTAAIIASKTLPSNIDMSYKKYGLEYFYQQLDYNLNPTKGYSLFLKGGVGSKRVFKNSVIANLEDPLDPEFSYVGLYDSLQTRFVQYTLETRANIYLKLFDNAIVNLGFKGGAVFADEIFTNEVYRIGGQKTLRGFNEQSVFATSYAISTVEYRYLLDRSSYLFLFSDIGYVENVSLNVPTYNTPIGFGVGLAFNTSAGFFNVSYAYGSFNGPVDFRAAKVHFGYTNYF